MGILYRLRKATHQGRKNAPLPPGIPEKFNSPPLRLAYVPQNAHFHSRAIHASHNLCTVHLLGGPIPKLMKNKIKPRALLQGIPAKRWYLAFFYGVVLAAGTTTAQSFEQLELTAFDNQRFHSNSSSWADADGDGDEDLFITNGESREPNEFYRNDGDGRFTRVDNALTAKMVPSFSAVWGDYDRDGDLDVYIANCDYTKQGGAPNALFRNDGQGQFSPLTDDPVVTDAQPSYAASWVDYDGDGWLDLYVVNAYRYANRLYRNRGDGSFERITTGPVANEVQHTISCSWIDYDNDGDQDLYVINTDRLAHNLCYENDGRGNFREVYNALANERFIAARSASWGDYNNDGWLDVIVVDREDEDRLFLNMQNGDFRRVTDPEVDFHPDFSGNGSQWGDFDNDGDLDLILLHHFEIPREFHQNQGDGRFELLTNEWTASEEGFAWSLSAVDFDADGDLDICQSNRFRTGGGILHNFLFRNTTEDCRSALVVSLQGIASNPQRYGDQVRVYGQNPAGQSALQMRELSCLSGGGYTTQSGTRLHFGLGDWSIDSLVVDWPSGAHLRYEDLPWYDRHLLLREDGGWAELDDFKRLRIRATRRPDCPGTINELWARHFTAPLEWFQLDVFGAETLVGEGERLAVPLVRGELVYVAEDVCGQRDTFSVNHGEHLESKIFPNPTTGLCQLVLAAPPGQDQAQVRIYDTTGRLMDDLILSLEAGFVRQQLDLRHYAAGTYLVQIEGPCWQSLEKIVVMQL